MRRMTLMSSVAIYWEEVRTATVARAPKSAWMRANAFSPCILQRINARGQRGHHLTPPPPPSLPHTLVGDAPTATLRWRPLNVDMSTPSASTVACIDRLFVLAFYRRRHIARMLVLNCLVDVLDQGPKSNVSFSRVSVFFPEDQRLLAIFNVFQQLGFRQVGAKRPDDPSGLWGSPAGRSFVEMALPMAEVLQVLQAAHEAGETIKPRPLVA